MEILMEIHNSPIVSEELKDDLNEIVNAICYDGFEKCDVDSRCEHGYPNYCEGCPHLNENE